MPGAFRFRLVIKSFPEREVAMKKQEGLMPTTASASDPLAGMRARRIEEESFDFNGWKIVVRKSPILPSVCYCESKRDAVQAYEGNGADLKPLSASTEIGRAHV